MNTVPSVHGPGSPTHPDSGSVAGAGNDNGLTDTTPLASRAEALQWMQEAEALRRQADFARYIPLIQRVIAWAHRNSDLELLGRGLLMRGVAHYVQDRNLEAALDLQEAVRLCKAHAAPEYEAEALNFSAGLAHRCGDTARSVALNRAALACLPQLPELAQRRHHILLGLSLTLQERAGEYVEATHCSSEALALVESDPTTPPLLLFRARAVVAYFNAMHADSLAALGQQAQARRLLDAAAAAAPALTDLRASDPPMLQAFALSWMLPVLALLGRQTEARHAAALALSLSRRTTQAPVRNNVLEYLAAMHRIQGDSMQSLRQEMRLLGHLEAGGYSTEITRCQLRMVRLHALQGRYEEALRVLGTHRRQRSQHELTERLLRCRVAAVERQAERRRQQAREINAHSARLAVIGRLIAHTHHALNAPLSLAHQCLAAPPGNPQELQQRMVDVNRCIDRATVLVTQLKLFSYRAVPQQMALSLRDALHEAQQGLLAQGHGTELVVGFAGDAQLLAWADPQRLGILLKVLLLELMQRFGNAPVLADVQVLPDGQIALSVHTQTCAPAPAPLPAPRDGADQPTSMSLGLSLCGEIALEMGGSLQMHNGYEQATEGLVCCLRLPGGPGPARSAAASAVQAATP